MDAVKPAQAAGVNPDEQTFGNCRAVDTKEKITVKPHPPSGAERADCAETLALLPKHLDQMFRDKGRIDGPGKLVRLDQQSFTDDGYSNTALQNNTRAGARSKSGCISSVLIAMDCQKDSGNNVCQALTWAHERSMAGQTMAVVHYTGPKASLVPPSTVPTMVAEKCVGCKRSIMASPDIVTRGRELGSYPPRYICDLCRKKPEFADA